MIYISQQPELFAPTLIHSDIPNELYHHGTKGQKWGVRRYQNPDGSLTEEGKIHYGRGVAGFVKKHREKKIKNSLGSIEKTKSDITSAKKDVERAGYNFRKASKDYSTAVRRSDVAKADLDTNIEIGERKLFGNRSGIREAERNYSSAKQKEVDSRTRFDEATVELDRSTVTLDELKSRKSQEIQRTSILLNKYVDKYGRVTTKELMASNRRSNS